MLFFSVEHFLSCCFILKTRMNKIQPLEIRVKLIYLERVRDVCKPSKAARHQNQKQDSSCIPSQTESKIREKNIAPGYLN